MRATRILGTVSAVAVLALPLMAMSPASAAPSTLKTASVSVLHGIPGLTVDVCASGKVLIPGFKPGTLTDPLKVPGGTYDIGLQAAVPGIAPGTECAGPIVLNASVSLTAGKDYTVTANLDSAGKPALNLFTNNRAATGNDKGRLTVRHVAAAPAVELFVNGTEVKQGLTNPNGFQQTLKKGGYALGAGLSGAEPDLIAVQASVAIKEGYNLIVYAWGVPQTVGGDGVKIATQYVKTVSNKR